MTGHALWQRALTLLGCSADGTQATGGATLQRHALAVVNQIAAEAWYAAHDTPFEPLASLAQPLPLPPVVTDTVLPYGVAMLAAQLMGDNDNQTLFALLYDQHRSGAVRTERRVRDCLPAPHHGGGL